MVPVQKSVSLVLAAALATSGCSVALVDGPKVSPAGKVECTDRYTLPLVDASISAVTLVTPFALELTRDRSMTDPYKVTSVVMWGAAVATAISTVVGVSRVKRCRRLHDSIERTTPPGDPSLQPAPMGPQPASASQSLPPQPSPEPPAP